MGIPKRENKMNMKTTRALRDLLSIILAACKDKHYEDNVEISIEKDGYHHQSILIKFIKEVK